MCAQLSLSPPPPHISCGNLQRCSKHVIYCLIKQRAGNLSVLVELLCRTHSQCCHHVVCSRNNWHCGSYVYWTVHHLDSWVKGDQLDAICFIITLFSAQHVSDVNTAILRSLRLIRRVTSWVVSGSMCVGVPYAGWSLHTDTTPP